MADLEASTNTPARSLPTYGEAVGTSQDAKTAANSNGTPLTEEERKKEEELGRQSELSSLREGIDILGQQDVDPALSQKMHMVNNVSKHMRWEDELRGDTRQQDRLLTCAIRPLTTSAGRRTTGSSLC
jgi:hypothetical protein